MRLRLGMLMLLLSSASCSKILGFNEAKHQDASVITEAGSDAASANGSATCSFDDPSSTFDGPCVFGN